MSPEQLFEQEKENQIKEQGINLPLLEVSQKFMVESIKAKYSYNFSWMGRPIIQYPQDIMAMQELIWELKPDLIIETGIAHGGSLVFYASLLELIGHGEVLGIDIDIREHNKKAIEDHVMFKRITMIEGSSISPEVINEVKIHCKGKNKIMVLLDSNHTHQHVLEELKLYADFVSINSYLAVFDGIVEFIPDENNPTSRPWAKGNNPYTAIQEFLKINNNFIVDKNIDNKILLSVAPGGYLKRIR